MHSVSTGNPCLTRHPRKSLSNAPPNPRHDKDSEATQRTRPDHRPGGHQPSNQPWVSVRSQWSPSRHDLKSAPLAGWEINLPWTATVHSITSNQHFKLSEGSAFLCCFIEVATGYCWSTVPYSVLFGTTLQSYLTKGFLHRPAGGRAPIRRSTTSSGKLGLRLALEFLLGC